jgi:hypothetical protein
MTRPRLKPEVFQIQEQGITVTNSSGNLEDFITLQATFIPIYVLSESVFFFTLCEMFHF